LDNQAATKELVLQSGLESEKRTDFHKVIIDRQKLLCAFALIDNWTSN
jgi:hypothetical protein